MGLYNPEFLLAEEIEFMARFKKHYKLKYIEIPLYRYTQHVNSVTSDAQRFAAYTEKAKDNAWGKDEQNFYSNKKW